MKKRLLVVMFLPSLSLAFLDYYQAVRAYDRDDFARSQDILKKELINNPHDASLLFSLGDASYRLKEFDQAQAYFSKAFEQTKDPVLQQKALFNKGNTLVQKTKYKEALLEYEKVLRINPNNADAAHNKKVVEQLLKDQEEQERKQKEKNSDKSNDKSQNKEDQEEQKDSSQEKQENGNQQGNKEKGKGQSQQGKQHADDSNKNDNQPDNEHQNQPSNSSNSDNSNGKSDQDKKGSDKQQQGDQSLEDKVREQEGSQKDTKQSDQGSEKGQQNQKQPQSSSSNQQQPETPQDRQQDKADANKKQQNASEQQGKKSQQPLYAVQESESDEEKDELAKVIDQIDGESGKRLFKYMVNSKMEPQYGQKNW